MTAIARRKTENWSDWVPIGPDRDDLGALITRQELLTRLHDRSIDLPERTLTYWEMENHLPRPVRKRHDGAPRALYPVMAVDVVARMRELQDTGMSLRAAATSIRRERDMEFIRPDDLAVEHQQQIVEVELEKYARLWEKAHGERVAEIEYALISQNQLHLEGVRFGRNSE